MEELTLTRFRQADPTGWPPKALIVNEGTAKERRLIFFDRIELGRDPETTNFPSGKVLIDDATVSSRHCIVTQRQDGRCFVRDVSRNGTWLDGRRLVPNVESELHPGQRLTIGQDNLFQLEEIEHAESTFELDTAAGAKMQVQAEPLEVTVLVGDIRGYTVLVREAPATELQNSVDRVFTELEQVVVDMGGTLKEYQGDAIFAYWEAAPNPQHAEDACRAALRLAQRVEELAEQPDAWHVPGHRLGMDWALATGEVLVQAMGVDQRTGLSMLGEPVVLDASTGSIVVCEETRRRVSSHFRLHDLGEVPVPGFEDPQRAFSLLEEREGDTTQSLRGLER
jgi:class 3 adenylate cyclase